MRAFLTSIKSKKGLLIMVAIASFASLPSYGEDTIRAAWKVQEIHLPYFGLTTHYSCEGLRDKVQAYLEQLGVRKDAVVSVGVCDSISGPAWHPSVNITIAHAVPANDEQAKEFANDANRAKLIARLQRKKSAQAVVTDEPFDAVMKRVTLFAKDRSNTSSAGDCELLEQVRRDVLPKLDAKVIKDGVRCTPYQGSVGNPRMEVELLIPVPKEA
jgi:hypothetical protein